MGAGLPDKNNSQKIAHDNNPLNRRDHQPRREGQFGG
jgi:hypothetical protein